MNNDPFDDPFFNDEEESNPFDEVRSMQRRGAIGSIVGVLIGIGAGVGTFAYAEPSVGVWAILIALVVFAVVGYISVATLASALMFMGGSK